MKHANQFLPIGPVNIGPGERILTGGIGGALLLLGLDRGGGAGSALALAGGLLLLRASSGHCPLYQQMDRRASAPGRHGAHSRPARHSAPDVAEVLSGPHPDPFADRTPPEQRDRVEEASMESFPASDSPSYHKAAK
ncbi:YgaP-like transmembrane domain [Oleisolibacter albus]|uniref:YgaP-like transmembrane domain n=1 Tax=Oleisolibacter albus TaxID=2171757 RepID=UPI000DF308FC|nr:YgaP-like transmembrane domain [Oleisolibacter albus]